MKDNIINNINPNYTPIYKNNQLDRISDMKAEPHDNLQCIIFHIHMVNYLLNMRNNNLPYKNKT